MRYSSSRDLIALFRVQLRVARLFDARPRLKFLLELDLVAPRAGDTPSTHGARVARTVTAWQRAFLGGSHYKPSRSLASFVREAWREGAAVASSSRTGELRGTDELVDAAFSAQLALVRIAAADESALSRADHVLPSMSPPPGELEEVDVLQPGCLLIENAAATMPGRALVFIWDVSRNVASEGEPADGDGASRSPPDDSSWAMRGFVVNRPFPSTVSAVMGIGSESLGLLGSTTLFHGGPDGDGRLSVVHVWADVPGAVPVNEEGTLFLGGELGALNARLAAGGAAAAQQLRVYMGYCVLPLVNKSLGAMVAAAPGGADLSSGERVESDSPPPPPDLEMEDDRFLFVSGPGVSDLLLASPMFDTDGYFRDGAGLGIRDVINGYNHARFWRKWPGLSCYHATTNMHPKLCADQNVAWNASIRSLAGSGGRYDTRLAELADCVSLHAAAAHDALAALPVPWTPLASTHEQGATYTDSEASESVHFIDADVSPARSNS